MLNSIRRALGLHVHEWEGVADETFEVHSKLAAKHQDFVQPGWRPWDIAPSPPTMGLMTFKCRTCGRVRTTRVRVG